eukprot:gene16482-18121_t
MLQKLCTMTKFIIHINDIKRVESIDEFLLQFHEGLQQGSKTGGMAVSMASAIAVSSNDSETTSGVFSLVRLKASASISYCLFGTTNILGENSSDACVTCISVQRKTFIEIRGEGNLPSPTTTTLLPEATISKSAAIKTPTEQKRQGQRQDPSSVNSQWKALTSDKTILQTVVGDTIEFIEQPPEMSIILRNYIAKEHAEQVYTELSDLIDKKVIVLCDHEPGEFISPIFSVPKKDNKIRLILNLKSMNQYVQYHHFKMDSIHTALELITEDCWMASIDLKDAYYSVKVLQFTQKSQYTLPQKQITFLGFDINSTSMKITLTKDKITKLINSMSNLLEKNTSSIRQVAQVIGYIVSSLPAVRYGQCHYRSIEKDKINALKEAKGNFDAQMYLSSKARLELNWWLANIYTSFNYIQQPKVDAVICSDASLFGWGAVMENTSTGGQWSYTEAKNHINYLELLAAYFALKSFFHEIGGKHVKIMIDNTTAVAVINTMGTCHSDSCNSIACEIWQFCETNVMWLTAAHIPGTENIIADRESRNTNIDTEWMLNPKVLFEVLHDIPFSPTIDLFASRLNHQFDEYVSYRQDPYAKHINAFSLSWTNEKFYSFPPFSCILKVIRKIIADQATGILVVPDWATQTWYPLLLGVLEQPPIILKPSVELLIMPSQPNLRHPLHKSLRLAICLVSGKHYK